MSPSEGDRRPRVSRRRERGTATLEYTAAFAMAALLAVGAILALKQGQLDVVARDAICKVKVAITGGSCSSSGQPGRTGQPPFDPKPPQCKISSHSQEVNSEVKIWFIKIGDNAGFLETKYSDGSVTYTATDGGSLGAEGGVGAKFDVGKLKAGADVDFGGGLKFKYGSTWTFKNQAEADAMKKQLDDYLTQQEIITHDPEAAAGLAIYPGLKDPPKPPNQSVSTFTVEGSVDGSVGISLPWDNNSSGSSGSSRSSGSSGSGDQNGQGGLPNLKLAKIGLGIGGNIDWSQITNNDTGAITYTTNYQGYAKGDGTLGPLQGQVKGLLGSQLSITRDKSGKITNVTITSTTSGSVSGSINTGQKDLGGQAKNGGGQGNVHVTTTSLPVTDDNQRAQLEQWLQQGAIVTPEMITPTTAAANDPIQNLFYQRGQVSQVDYNQVTDTEGFAAEVKLGVEFGIDLSYTDDKTTAVNADYLGAPDNSGVRQPVNFPECLGK
ncbi:MAG: hypothetical protein J2P23_02755 [Microlunatus sp.]|nr:hypothetical protein [Microlunatus sp.]